MVELSEWEVQKKTLLRGVREGQGACTRRVEGGCIRMQMLSHARRTHCPSCHNSNSRSRASRERRVVRGRSWGAGIVRRQPTGEARTHPLPMIHRKVLRPRATSRRLRAGAPSTRWRGPARWTPTNLTILQARLGLALAFGTLQVVRLPVRQTRARSAPRLRAWPGRILPPASCPLKGATAPSRLAPNFPRTPWVSSCRSVSFCER